MPPTTQVVDPEVPGFLVADAAGPQVEIFSEPGVPHPDKPPMDNPTHEGLAVVFLVLEEQPEGLAQQRIIFDQKDRSGGFSHSG